MPLRSNNVSTPPISILPWLGVQAGLPVKGLFAIQFATPAMVAQDRLTVAYGFRA